MPPRSRRSKWWTCAEPRGTVRGMIRLPLAAAILVLSVPALAEPSQALKQQVDSALAGAPAGTRFGLLVLDDQGREVFALNPDQRFIPASNTKLFTTALALDTIGRDALALTRDSTWVSLLDRGKAPPDVLIRGGGGASLSTAPDCVMRCLAIAVAQISPKTRKIGDVIADDTAFPDQRWSPGMSWNNIGTDSGTAASALLVDDNQLPLTVTPGSLGERPAVAVSPYFTVRNEAVTVATGPDDLRVERSVNGRELRIFGQLAVNGKPWKDLIGIDDPAEYAAWALRQALVAQGIKVSGGIKVRHRPVDLPGAVPVSLAPLPKAMQSVAFTAVPLDEEVAAVNKPSQNLHAEMLLRRAGISAQDNSLYPALPPQQRGSREAGLAVLQAMLDKAGISRLSYDFADGSGMSSYNRVSPRAAVQLLRWGARQSWGPVWRASLPIGGTDGTLRRRFAGTALQGRLWAKTGTLNATNALSGYLAAASGRELTFAAFANDVPGDKSATAALDAALLAIAAAN